MFQKPNPKQSFPELEREMIEYWKKIKMFEKSLEKTKGSPEYIFYDGPPFATGLPHYGHILAGTLKDVIPRYQTMRGNYVPRRWGWDCHGLPIENLVEQELNLKEKKAILEFGIDKFNEACRASVLRYVKEWGKVVERMGRWVDFEDSYKTMDSSYMESIWWVFKKLWDKKLIYKGKKTMHICPRCETPLSNFEVGMGYKDISDLSVIWKFKLLDNEPSTSNSSSLSLRAEGQQPKTSLLAWTTTPWSTLSTMGLSANPKFAYIKVKCNNEYLIFAKERLDFVMKGISDYEIIEELSGEKLIGKRYEHIAPWYLENSEVKRNPNVFKVYAGDYVEITEGTGIVTINGAYGEIDLQAARKNKLPVLMDVSMDGKFNQLAGPFSGISVKEAERQLVEYFGQKNLVFRHEPYAHSYPHCWRCETPLINYCSDSWFVAVEKIKKKMLKANNKINWVPAHIKHGRFGKWLENARDWAISRNRYWGTPLPVWTSDKGTMECLGSMADLRSRIPNRFTKITLLRHGESEGNLMYLRQSKPPGTPLTKRGEKQSEEAALKLFEIHKKEPFDMIVASPLLRTQETAQIIGKKLGLPVQKDSLITEIDFGETEGKRDQEIKNEVIRRHSLAPDEHYRDPLGRIGESHAKLTERAMNFIQKMLKEHPGKSILVVTHSDIVRFVLRELEEKPLSLVYAKGHVPQCVPKELYLDTATGKLIDLHKHVVDNMTYRHPKTGELMKRISEVLDCWFESGSMPYAQVHYPFENKDRFEATFPANFIAEGLDQTRGWFYTLIVLSAALFDQPAFQNIIVNGIVLAEDGQKMSKRKKNYPDPNHIFETYGVDAMRLYLMNSPVVKAEDFRFSEKGVEEVVRSILLPLWNAYTFFLTYALIDGWKPKNQIYFVRHGETGFNQQGAVQGFLDDPLSDTGRDQAEAIAETVKHLPIDIIVTSDFLRAQETAKILNANLNLPIEIMVGLREQSYGEWEGKTFEELSDLLYKNTKPNSPSIHFDLRNKPPKGETLLDFEKRVIKTLKIIEKKYAGKNVLIVSHAGVHHILQKRQLKLKTWKQYYPKHYRLVKNASLSIFSFQKTNRPANALDRWMLSELHNLIRNMTSGLDHYDLIEGLAPLVSGIDSLTNWYIRRSRRRFWKSENDQDKAQAYQTLYTVLISICKLLAPFAPFIVEAMYRNLTGMLSVHLSEWPVADKKMVDEILNAETNLIRKIVMLGHAARAKAKVKVRQPLSKIEVAFPDFYPKLSEENFQVIKEELNIKEVIFISSTEGKVKTVIKPNARLLGPKYGAKVQDIIRAAKASQFEQLKDGKIKILGYELSPEEAQISFESLETQKDSNPVEADSGVVVILDTTITPKLFREGYSRDLIRAVQDLRKQADLNVSDHIIVGLTTDNAEIQQAISEFQDVIQKETLATKLMQEKQSSGFESVVDLSGHGVVVTIEKI